MQTVTQTIPIGITARNEAKNIVSLIDSLRAAIVRAGAELGCSYSLHVLLNDNHDETPRLLEREPDLTIWHTRGGIVEAQRALAEKSAGAPFLVFSDADIRVDPEALTAVSRVMLTCAEVEIAYAEKRPLSPQRATPLARALYLYNLREGYQSHRHYLNGQFFAIRNWRIPRTDELRWDPVLDNPFRNLGAGIRCDDIYLSREALRTLGPESIRCVPPAILYRPPETLRGMFRKYQRMVLEIERLDCYFPDTVAVHRRWGQRRLDRARLKTAPAREKVYYGLFQAALALCKLAYCAQRIYYTHLSTRPCPTWEPVVESKERL